MPAFVRNDVTADVLMGAHGALTNDDLKELGVTSLGHRKQLIAAAAVLAQRGSPRHCPPTDGTVDVRLDR
eukprot:gene32439-48495_t